MSHSHPDLPEFIASEATGDWSGLKGSHYHMLAAVYLMLVHARNVTFYAGNDLHSVISELVAPNGQDGLGVALEDKDEWLQAKNVSDAWTNNRVLNDDTLVSTFILNALWSHHRRRDWTVRLFTSA